MNPFKRKIMLRVVGIHVAIVLWLIISSFLRGCFRPREKEIVTFIEFGAPAPAVQVEEVSQMADPEAPAPEPTPEPEPAPIPEPAKVTPKPKPTPKPQQPKWTATKPEDILKGQKVTPSTPTVSADDIKKALSDIASPSAKGGTSDANAAYDSHIYTVFYNAWHRPSSPSARPAEVTISIQSSGRIIKRSLTQSSGDSDFDQTVMAAVNSVSMFPRRPPAGYPLNNIVVQFRIID